MKHIRGKFEIWLDRHNHKMELMRTTSSFLNTIVASMALIISTASLIVSTIVLLKLFGYLGD